MEQRKIKKETLKRAAAATLQYWKTGDPSFLTLKIRHCKKLSEQAFNTLYQWDCFEAIINGMALHHICNLKQKTYNFPYKKLCKAIELLGFEIVDEVE